MMIDAHEIPPKSSAFFDFGVDRNSKGLVRNIGDRNISPVNGLSFGSGEACPEWVDGVGGKMLAFDGGDHLYMANDSNVDKTAFNTTNQRIVLYALFCVTTDQSGYIFTKNTSSVGTTQFGIRYSAVNNSVVIAISNAERMETTVNSIELNKNYLVVFDFDGATIRSWINGIPNNSVAYSLASVTSRTNFVIGARSNAADLSALATYFIGKIGFVGISYGNVTGLDILAWAKRINLYEKWKLTDQKKLKLLLSECDNTDDFDFIYSCAKALDAVNKTSGTASIKLTKNADAVGYFLADITRNLDLSKYVGIKYSFYVANKSNITTVGVILFTTSDKSYDESFRHYVGWQIVNGWNTFSINFADFDKYGTGNLRDIKAIRLLISLLVDNATEVVNFDLIELY